MMSLCRADNVWLQQKRRPQALGGGHADADRLAKAIFERMTMAKSLPNKEITLR